MAESASFCGGPEPVNGLVRVHLEEDLMNPRFKPLPPERDEEWHELIRCGGGGEVPDTPLQQAARYQTENPNSPEPAARSPRIFTRFVRPIQAWKSTVSPSLMCGAQKELRLRHLRSRLMLVHGLELLKVLAAVVLFSIAVAGGLLPLYLHRSDSDEESLRTCNAMAGGVLLSAALVHMLPDAQKALGAVSVDFHKVFNPETEEAFPLSSVLAGLAFLGLMIMEAQVQRRAEEEVQAHCSVNCLDSPCLEGQCLHSHGVDSPTSARALKVARTKSLLRSGTAHKEFTRMHERANTEKLVASVTDVAPDCISARVLVCALAVHSLLEGISIGVLNHTSTFLSIFIAVAAHKGLAAFAMGARLVQCADRKELWQSVLLFGSCTPVGIVLGSFFLSNAQGAGVGCLLSLATGTFLYISVPELLLPAVEASDHSRMVIMASILGFLAMRLGVVITSSMDYLIRTWDVKKGFKMHQEFTGHLNFVNQVLPYRGDKILSCSDDYTCRLWQIGEAGTEGELLFTYWINMYPMKAVCALPGQRAGVGGLDKTVRIFSLVTGCTLFRMTDHRDFGPDRNFFQKEGCGIIWCMLHLRNNIIASGSDDCTVRLWDIDQGKCLCTQIGHKGYGEDIGEPGLGWKLAERFATVIRMCHLGKDGQQFASCSYDRTITIWDATTPTDLQVLRNFKAHGNGIVGLGIAGKQHLVSCSGDKTVKVWNFETGELEREIPTRGIASDACMIDDGTIFIAGGDATIRIYNWREDKEVKQFYAHDLTLQFCAPVFLAQKDPRNWTEVPIMYQNITYPENEADSKCALEQMRKILYNALNYAEIS
ncbi:unnamed protein product [Effrenium voratum]|uniref:Uncharacterized protein n=1 Tax=Effrenium voratum TaxID=2562239 RepID=A0AA36JRY8_9DINO|nr:unnamed protein product [Effrenium voratum]